jgi:hypothetical protein
MTKTIHFFLIRFIDSLCGHKLIWSYSRLRDSNNTIVVDPDPDLDPELKILWIRMTDSKGKKTKKLRTKLPFLATYFFKFLIKFILLLISVLKNLKN